LHVTLAHTVYSVRSAFRAIHHAIPKLPLPRGHCVNHQTRYIQYFSALVKAHLRMRYVFKHIAGEYEIKFFLVELRQVARVTQFIIHIRKVFGLEASN
jgi:hypothetical protein